MDYDRINKLTNEQMAEMRGMFGESDELVQLRRDLAASRAECERLRGALLRISRGEYWAQEIAAEALAAPAASGGGDGSDPPQ